MDEEIRSRVISYLDTIEKTVADSATFAADQAPEVVNEMILVGRIGSTSMVSIAFAVMCLPIIFYLVGRKCELGDRGDCLGVSAIVGILTTIIGGIILSESLRPCLTSWFAPRLYVLEEIARMVN